MKKFDWQATESAPKNYPMEILYGTLYYHGQQSGLYVPNGSLIHHGWGRGISSHVVGEELKPLPSKLAITFFSYTENQFYRGKFDLPYDKILALFQAGFYSPNQEKDITYDQIIVGVAPGGVVSVWLWGYEKITQVFFSQAEKVDIEWSNLTSATDVTRDEYVKEMLQYVLKTPEALESLRKNGIPFGLWHTYHMRYNWQPVLTGMMLRDDRIGLIKYFNGEQDYLNYPLEKTVATSNRAIPSYMSFIWNRTGRLADDVSFKLNFNEAENFAAYKKLGSNNQELKLELLMVKTDKGYDFTVWLHNEKEKLELKHTTFKTFRPSGMRYENASSEATE